jgi:zinc protease
MRPTRLQKAAATLKPYALTWVVVRDLKQIEAKVRVLNFGEVTVIDADGNKLR